MLPGLFVSTLTISPQHSEPPTKTRETMRGRRCNTALPPCLQTDREEQQGFMGFAQVCSRLSTGPGLPPNSHVNAPVVSSASPTIFHKAFHKLLSGTHMASAGTDTRTQVADAATRARCIQDQSPAEDSSRLAKEGDGLREAEHRRAGITRGARIPEVLAAA